MNIRITPLCILAALGLSPVLHADLVLETETAELGKKGEWLVSTAVQFERERDGSTSIFTLNQYEVGLTDRAEILIEPFFMEWGHPKGEKSYHGMGDLEITPSYMVILETEKTPAVVLALKVKVPTARNRAIGTREFDYYPYIILGKKWGDWLFNANFGRDFIKSPADEPLKDQWIYDFSAERVVTEKLSLIAEIFGESKPAAGEKAVFAGAVATEYKFTEHYNAFLSVGYDTDHTMAIRSGFNITY